MSADLTVPPPMPAPVLAFGSVEQDCFTGDQIAARDAIWSERIAALLRAVPPLPVVAYMFQPPNLAVAPKLDIAPHGGAWQQLVRKDDADAALASLQARMEAAERDAAWWRNVADSWALLAKTDKRLAAISEQFAIDAATQERPAAPVEPSEGGAG